MTIFEAYNHTKRELTAAGIEDTVFEAKQIIRHVTGLSGAQILSNYTHPLTDFQQNNLTVILKQRKIRYPLQYIFHEWDFYGRTYGVGPGVLCPRADTETLVDTALNFLKDKENPKVLDLCAGSGCIGITVACEVPTAEVILVEKYPEAMRYLKENIERNGAKSAKVVQGDVLAADGFVQYAEEGSIDLIVSNPPYIPKAEMQTISPETRFEPETALLGGEDGTVFYRAILTGGIPLLKPGGMVAFEVGAGQAAEGLTLMKGAGLADIDTKRDLNGIERVVFGTVKLVK